MKCAKCGAEIQEDTIFCPECGSYIELKRTEERETNRENRELEGEESNKIGKIDAEIADSGYATNTETAAQNFDNTGYEQTSSQPGVNGSQYFDWQANQTANYPSGGKPKKSKAPYIVMGIIGTAITVTLIYLVITLTGVDKAKSYVEKALHNTFEELAEDERADILEEILAGDQVSQQMSVTLSELTMAEQGMASDLLKDYAPIKFSLSVDANKIAAEAMLAFTGMAGDMKPARLEIFVDSAGAILGFPGIYDSYLGISPDDIENLTGMEINPEAVSEVDRRQEALEAFVETLKEWYSELYKDVSCEKTETVKLDTGSSIVEADEYMLSLSEREYAKHMKNLPKLIEENKVFMSWYASVTSDSEADYFIEGLENIVEESMVDSWVSKVILCYVRISEDRAVELRIPLDDGKKQEGELVVSFFGKEKLGDDLRIDLQMSVDGESASAQYYAVKDGDKNSIHLSADFNKTLSIEMSLDGEYHVTDSEYSYDMKEFDIIVATKNYLGESTSVKLGLNGSYIVTKAEEFTVPDYADTIHIAEMDSQELWELILTILDNALERGYVPSAYTEELSRVVAQLKGQTIPSNGIGDNGGGNLDGSEYLTYEEFVSMVKELYGDIYSDEALRELYNSIYGDVENSMGNETSHTLFCEDGDLILEIMQVEGFIKDQEYSNDYELVYIKNIGDTDQILLDYQITTEKMEESMQDSLEFQREYYTESGFTDISISEIQHGMIGGFQAAWIEYHVSDTEGNKASGFDVYIQIDEEHGCILDMYSLFGTEEVSSDLLMKCFEIYLIEQ